MNKEELRDNLYNSIISHMRKEEPKIIDAAYTFFWEEEYPEDFIGGRALELAFINFEDWLICDYISPEGVSTIDLFKQKNEVDKDAEDMLSAMKSSFISLYEVLASKDGLTLKDLVLDEEVGFQTNPLPQLEDGSVFAARIIESKEENLLGRCVYPFTKSVLDDIMTAINKNFKRYKKKNPDGELRQFLADESYLFNTLWVSNLAKKTA